MMKAAPIMKSSEHEEYYKFAAFFNDTRDEDTWGDYPQYRSYNDTLGREVNEVVNWIKQNASPQRAEETAEFLKTWQPSYNSLLCDSFTNSELNDTKWTAFRNGAVCRLRNVDLDNKDHLIYRYAGFVNGGIWQIHLDNANGEVIASVSLPKVKSYWGIAETDIKPASGVHNLIFTYTNNHLKKPTDNGAILDWLYFTQAFPGKDKPSYDTTKKAFWKLINADVPTTPVMMDNPSDMHRTSYVFERGNWLMKGDSVRADVPHSLNAFPRNLPHNRLGRNNCSEPAWLKHWKISAPKALRPRILSYWIIWAIISLPMISGV